MNKKVLSTIILAMFLAIFCYSGYQLYLIYHNYHVAEVEYDNLVEQYVVAPTAAPAEQVEAADAPVAEEPYPPLTIDFAALSAVNADIVGWLYLESCDINYPIVQGADNEYYLYRTFEKQSNSCGSIFMDNRNLPDFYDYNTFLYGHNMKNGSMFGKLKDLYREEGLCDKDPYFYIYLADGEVLKYRIFSYYITTDVSDSYNFIKDDAGYDAYVKTAKSRSSYKSTLNSDEYEEALQNRCTLVTLSTCSGPTNGNQRFLVHGVCVENFHRDLGSE